MGLYDFLKRKNAASQSLHQDRQVAYSPPPDSAVLTKHQIEEVVVWRTSLQDMMPYTSLPYVWDNDIQKVIGPSIQPYAYMDITGANVRTAKDALGEINNLLAEALFLPDLIPCRLQIPISDIVFAPRMAKSYSKIVCTPHTYTGKRSKYPFHLLFMTDLLLDEDSTHGKLYYGQSGKIEKGRNQS